MRNNVNENVATHTQTHMYKTLWRMQGKRNVVIIGDNHEYK